MTATATAPSRAVLIARAATRPIWEFYDNLDSLLGPLELELEDFIEKFLIGAAVSCEWEEEICATVHYSRKGCEDSEEFGTGEYETVEVLGTILGFSEPDFNKERRLLVQPAHRGGRSSIDEEHYEKMLVGYISSDALHR